MWLVAATYGTVSHAEHRRGIQLLYFSPCVPINNSKCPGHRVSALQGFPLTSQIIPIQNSNVSHMNNWAWTTWPESMARSLFSWFEPVTIRSHTKHATQSHSVAKNRGKSLCILVHLLGNAFSSQMVCINLKPQCTLFWLRHFCKSRLYLSVNNYRNRKFV